MSHTIVKKINDSYLYGVSSYEKEIFNYAMTAKIIDKESEAFSDVVYQITHRATAPVIVKVMMSKKVRLCLTPKKPMPRPYKVMYLKDVKNKEGDRYVYIDCTDIIVEDGGVYKCKEPAKLISYLISAMTYIMYYNIPDKIQRNTSLVESSTEAFVDLMLYILGYLKVSVTYSNNKERMAFVLATYFQRCILCKTDDEIIQAMAKKISELDPKTCDYYASVFNPWYGNKPFVNIKEFVEKFAEVFLNQEAASKDKNRLTIDAVVGRWMYAFGEGTYFGLEIFPAFASILTDCYVGAYINQQNTIEKIVGTNVAAFTNTLLDVGSENA